SFTNREDYFEYTTGYEPPSDTGEPQRTAEPQTRHRLGERVWRFFEMGVEHIFLGYDHICFLIGLIVVSRFREIVKIVTSFTIAHSITLILATLDAIRLPTRLIEPGIAATIVYVAVENLWILHAWGLGTQKSGLGIGQASADTRSSIPNPTRHRWWLTFFFGL